MKARYPLLLLLLLLLGCEGKQRPKSPRPKPRSESEIKLDQIQGKLNECRNKQRSLVGLFEDFELQKEQVFQQFEELGIHEVSQIQSSEKGKILANELIEIKHHLKHIEEKREILSRFQVQIESVQRRTKRHNALEEVGVSIEDINKEIQEVLAMKMDLDETFNIDGLTLDLEIDDLKEEFDKRKSVKSPSIVPNKSSSIVPNREKSVCSTLHGPGIIKRKQKKTAPVSHPRPATCFPKDGPIVQYTYVENGPFSGQGGGGTDIEVQEGDIDISAMVANATGDIGFVIGGDQPRKQNRSEHCIHWAKQCEYLRHVYDELTRLRAVYRSRGQDPWSYRIQQKQAYDQWTYAYSQYRKAGGK